MQAVTRIPSVVGGAYRFLMQEEQGPGGRIFPGGPTPSDCQAVGPGAVATILSSADLLSSGRLGSVPP